MGCYCSSTVLQFLNFWSYTRGQCQHHFHQPIILQSLDLSLTMNYTNQFDIFEILDICYIHHFVIYHEGLHEKHDMEIDHIANKTFAKNMGESDLVICFHFLLDAIVLLTLGKPMRVC